MHPHDSNVTDINSTLEKEKGRDNWEKEKARGKRNRREMTEKVQGLAKEFVS